MYGRNSFTKKSYDLILAIASSVLSPESPGRDTPAKPARPEKAPSLLLRELSEPVGVSIALDVYMFGNDRAKRTEKSQQK